jgi:hypothetical protein
MSQIIRYPGYAKVVLTQVGDYVGIRTNDYKSFSCNIVSSSVFNGATIGSYKNFTKKDGTIGNCEAPNVTSGEDNIIYTKPQAISISAPVPSNWYIFRLESIGVGTNIIFTINGIDFKENIISNLSIENE